MADARAGTGWETKKLAWGLEMISVVRAAVGRSPTGRCETFVSTVLARVRLRTILDNGDADGDGTRANSVDQ